MPDPIPFQSAKTLSDAEILEFVEGVTARLRDEIEQHGLDSLFVLWVPSDSQINTNFVFYIRPDATAHGLLVGLEMAKDEVKEAIRDREEIGVCEE